MIVNSPALEAFEAQYQREAFRDLTYAQALAGFAALWEEARALRPDIGADWVDDIQADIAVARAVNGLSPDAKERISIGRISLHGRRRSPRFPGARISPLR